MISRKQEQFLTTICRHNGARIASIGAIAHVINDEYDNGATSRSIDLTRFLLLTLCKFHEKTLSFPETVSQCLNWILWEVFILYNELMQVVSEEIGTYRTAMPVVNSKEGALWPLLTFVILGFRFHNIQNYCNAILIIVADDTLIRICAISCNQTIALI